MTRRLLVVGALTAQLSIGQDAAVPLNTPEVFTAEIAAGSTRVTIPFPVSGCTGLRLDAIVPLNSPTFSLADPDNRTVFPPGDPKVEFIPGTAARPGSNLPGGTFSLREEIVNPKSGTWNATFAYPAATRRTFAMLTPMCKSDYSAGIALARTEFIRGEQATIGMMVLRADAPVRGLSPRITIGPRNAAGGTVTLIGLDDGLDADGLANDGIYSVEHLFNQAGQFHIAGELQINTPEGPIVKRAQANVRVIEPTLQVGSITAAPVTGPGGCVTGLDIGIAAQVLRDGEFRVSAKLEAGNGRSVQESILSTFRAGAQTITIHFPAETLRSLGTPGPYTIGLVDAYSLVGEEIQLAFQRAAAGTTPRLDLDRLCAPPIEILEGAAATVNVAGGYIGSLTLTFSIRAQTAGNYDISFKVTGAGGEDIGVFSQPRSLDAGSPALVSVTLPASVFLSADGPYQVISMLVRGANNTAAQLSQVGETAAFSKWQFQPRVHGDLDDDLDVDAADRALLASFASQPALTPGDRRDINRDGQIDSTDLEALAALLCAAGECPTAP